MDYTTLSLIGLLLLVAGFIAGSRYRAARMNGATRVQAAKVIIQGGGGPGTGELPK